MEDQEKKLPEIDAPEPTPPGETPPPYPPPPEPPPPKSPPPAHHRGIIGPLLLILVGILFLLQNLGWIEWSVWEILWRFWPVWLIAIGLDMLLGRRGAWGGILAVGIIVTILAGALYYAGIWRSRPEGEWDSPAATLPATTIRQPLEEATEARVYIGTGVSRLSLRGGADPGLLIQGSVVPLDYEELDQRYEVDGASLRYTLQSDYGGPWSIPRPNAQGRWDLNLSQEVPIDLTLSTGIGESNVDLSGVKLTDLRLTSGIGQTTLTLPDSGQFKARISCGMGETTIRIPDSLAARIDVDMGFGDVRVSGNYVSEGGLYISENWSTAEDRVEIDVEGGFGPVRIITIPSE